jgi:glycosyltransferase involved in cell wall biosynthesis
MTTRRLVFNARTPVHYTMFAPVHRALRADPRVQVSLMASEEPNRAREIYRDTVAPAPLVSPLRAAATKFDAYVTSDFMWATLPRGTKRVQMFHGVGGKYGFDAPTESMRVWHRLFFVNRRRLDNCVAAGALDADSPAIRLIGMPKADCLVDGSLLRDVVLAANGLSPERPTVLYAPTWSPASSLNLLGVDLVRELAQRSYNVIVKLHDRSCDERPQYSGGIDWRAALGPHLVPDRVVLAAGPDISPYLAAADVMVTDHSSAGFEYLLRDRPLVRIHVPELIARANIHADYVNLMAEASHSTRGLEDTVTAVMRALEHPAEKAASRRAVAADLFHEPGTATHRAVAAMYELLELDAPVPNPRPRHIEQRSPGDAGLTVRLPVAPADGPVVSVIMPAYNAAAYLQASVQSVLRQTFAALELIVVDDGSADHTADVAAALAAADPRVRVLRQSNAGPGPARNAAFRIARGRYFAFLDSDDEWDADFLSAHLAVLEERPDIDVLVGNARARGGRRHAQPCRPVRATGRLIPLAEILADETALFIMCVFRREVIDAVGGFDPDLLTNEEYEMWIRAASQGFGFARLSTPLGWYTSRPDSLSASDVRMIAGILKVFAKTRRDLPPGSPERAIVDRQIVRFEGELAAAEARLSLAQRDTSNAARHLLALHRRRGGWLVRLAARVPALASALYRARGRLSPARHAAGGAG